MSTLKEIIQEFASSRFESPKEYKARSKRWATFERGTSGGGAKGVSALGMRYGNAPGGFKYPMYEDGDEGGKRIKLTPEVVGTITKFIKDNPNPSDDDFHDMAEKLGMDPSQAEEVVYKLAHKLLVKKEQVTEDDDEDEKEDEIEISLSDLKHAEDPDKKFNPRELKWGIEIEKEHHDNPDIAKAIAKAHLAEIPDYYTRLKKMEKEAGIKDYQ